MRTAAEALLERSPHIAKAIARDPDLLMKTVDLLLAESDATRKEAAARTVRHAAREHVETSDGRRISRRHGGNVLPAVRSEN